LARGHVNPAEALRIAEEAFDLLQHDRLADAEARYRDAIAGADPHDQRTADIHGQYAQVLTRLNRPGDAERHYERALALELQNQRKDETHPAVIAARYLLGEHYLRAGEAESARRVVRPSLEAADKPLAWVVEAEALWLSGSEAEARAAAQRALALAMTPDQRERMQSRLSELLEEPSR
jgi:Tfp pilus assembly protein PilF